MWQITITDPTGKPIGARCKRFKDKAEALDYMIASSALVITSKTMVRQNGQRLIAYEIPAP